MQPEFWHQKWQKGEIGFHEGLPNAFLVSYIDSLRLVEGSRVFLPLCGKTRDIAWLLAKGYRVAGAELSELAVKSLFAELGIEALISSAGSMTRYCAQNIDIFVGNIFDLNEAMLGKVDAVYDRAALVALPVQMRRDYTAHLTAITVAANQLLVTFEYDQSLLDGPPFSVTAAEVEQHYQRCFHVMCLEQRELAGGLKGKAAATESAWLLTKK